MDNILIVNKSELDRKVKLFKNNSNNFHVIADFDRTLTKAYSGQGKSTNTSFARIRESKYMDEKYKKRAYDLFNQYYPIEMDSEIPLDTKIKKMDEWWQKHLELMVEFGLNKKILKEIANDGMLIVREGLFEFLDILRKNNVPLLIFSAGLGDVIAEFLDSKKKLCNNLHIISNFYVFDERGIVVSYKEKCVHSFNKNEIQVKSHPYYNEIKQKRNVILLGDSLNDSQMADGIIHDCIIKIGFFNNPMIEEEENYSAKKQKSSLLEQYKKEYDVLILNDGSMDFIIQLINSIFENHK